MAGLDVSLSEFDPELLIEYAITEADLTNVYLCLQAMQPNFHPGTWGDICVGSYYGTSALLHEVVELRILLRREPYLLIFAAQEIRSFARQASNHDAHLRGLEAEYRYLQSIVRRIFGRQIDIGALLQANSKRQVD